MKKILMLALAAWTGLMALADGWEPSVKAGLDAVIARNRGKSDAYAVFDFDYTIALGDLSYTCLWRILETMDLRGGDLKALFARGVPADLQAEAVAVAAQAEALRARRGDVADFTSLPEWKAFVGRYWALYRRLHRRFGDNWACEWRFRLFVGYDGAGLRSLAEDAIARDLKRGGLKRDENAPTEKRGLVLAPEMVALVKAVQSAGIAVYVVSGSMRDTLLAATGQRFGLDIPPENVFGRDSGVVSGEKPTFIRKHILPLHHGRDPVLVAGDSFGDYKMLREFKGMEAGLLFHRHWREPEMWGLIRKGDPKILVQGRDESRGVYIPSHRSVFPRTAIRNFPMPSSWKPFLTREGALPKRNGHVQGMCVSSEAMYLALHTGIYKFDWAGNLATNVPCDKHTGDLCFWKGRVYSAVALPGAGKDGLRGRIDVFDENLRLLKQSHFKMPADGITCLDGVLYVGLGPNRNPKTPFLGSWFGTFDAETLKPLREPFLVDPGYDVCSGVQNMATDGTFIYVGFYTPREGAPCFSVFDKDMKPLQSHVFGWRHGFDVIGGGRDGAVRFVWLETIGWMDREAFPQALVNYAELKDGKISDISYHIIFRKPKPR